ncbi:MAG TPA: FHA domain-containing protein [Gemmatimonadaceae bacterium]|nr:FHA domain-containing protein [Gemmatimonadaceae bacterium]
MGGPVVVEVLDERGRVQHRVALRELPATIGRGYGNDVILDDPYVCPRHARIVRDADGALAVEDAASVNGLRDERGTRAERLPLRGAGVLRVGHTTLRVREASDPVPPAIADRGTPSRLPARLAPLRVSLGVGIGAFVIFALSAYLSSTMRVSVGDVVREALERSLTLAIWAAAWAVASRIVVHEFRFLRHWAVISAATVVWIVTQVAVGWLSFLYPDSAASTVFDAGSSIVLVGAVVYAHLVLASLLSRPRARRTAAAVTAALLAIALLFSLSSDRDSTSSITFDGALKPWGVRWVHTVSLDEFASGAADLRRQVDQLAGEH